MVIITVIIITTFTMDPSEAQRGLSLIQDHIANEIGEHDPHSNNIPIETKIVNPCSQGLPWASFDNL